jgi:hypothetical protein
MTADLKALESLTRDYAAFQTRKSGLATALGGLMALLLFLAALHPQLFRMRLLQRPALEVVAFIPFAWLAVKALAGRLFYGRLGTVKAIPDPAYARRLQTWLLGLALFLMACLVTAVYGFVSGSLLAGRPAGLCLSPDHPLLHPWTWLIWMPLLYLAPVPWAIRGIEEARAYAVLVGQCMLWFIPLFLFSFGAGSGAPALPKAAQMLAPLGFMGLLLGVAVWAALAMIRGWKEHRDYMAMLRNLPVGEA